MSKKAGMFAGAATVAFLVLTAVGRADTISYADAVSALAKDCGSDIKKLCSGLNVGNASTMFSIPQRREGDGNILSYLVKTKRVGNEEYDEAITDAG